MLHTSWRGAQSRASERARLADVEDPETGGIEAVRLEVEGHAHRRLAQRLVGQLELPQCIATRWRKLNLTTRVFDPADLRLSRGKRSSS